MTMEKKPNDKSITAAVTTATTTATIDDTDYSDLSFDSLENVLSMDFFSVPSSSWIVRAWNVLLASSAWMDFCAATVDARFRSYFTWETERFDPWLRNHAVPLGMLFSLLWFVDAFVTATAWRRQRLVQAEEARLLQSPGWEKIHPRRVKVQAWLDFAKAVILQLVLLPVGFYYVLWGHAALLRDNDDDDGNQKDIPIHKPDMNKTASHNTTETFTTTNAHNVSVLVTVLHFYLSASIRRLHKRLVTQGKKGLFHLMRRLLRHPVQAARRIQKITQWLRWIKIVGPLVGTSNKLLGNAVDLLKRARQRAAAQKAMRLRQRLWDQMTPQELRHYAATLIQKTYRAARQRKAFRALQLFRLDRERLAALRLQTLFRARLTRARYAISHKVAELERLQAKYYQDRQQQQKQSTLMTEEERQRMYKLKSELTQKAKTFLNQKLLLRPNTTFAVVWKALFVVGVILELSVLVAKALHPKGVTVESILPRLWYDLPECNPKEPGFFQKILHRFGRHRTSPILWYCQERAMAYQNMGVCILDFSIRTLIVTVQAIYFLDVFINFFTGRFNRQTGMLEPVPAFQRWVAPGIMLQLLLNPRMDVVADIVARLVTAIRALGPVRVFRWTVAFFFPVFLIFRHRASQGWSVIVASQNKGANRVAPLG